MILMDKIRRMLSHEKKDARLGLPGLEEFIRIAGENKLECKFSMKNIEDSIIELRYTRFHCGNGLLLTRDGYFVTALHCLDNTRAMSAKDRNGIKFRIEELCEASKDDDLALAKISLQGPPIAVAYNMQIDEKYSINQDIIMLAQWDNHLVKRKGVLKSPSSYMPVEMSKGKKAVRFPDHASARLSVVGGDSGSAIVNSEGQLLGILASGGKYSASYIESDNIIRLVKRYANKIKGLNALNESLG